MVSDPVGDFVTRLKNAAMVRRERVVAPYSKLKFAVADKLCQEGYVKEVAKRGRKTRKSIEVELTYDVSGAPAMHGVRRVSKPGKRAYISSAHLRPVRRGKGALILSTPKGILTGEEARKANVGGEALFEIW